MKKNRQSLIEDRKALRDAIKRALALEDAEEVERLTRHLNWLEKKLKRRKS